MSARAYSTAVEADEQRLFPLLSYEGGDEIGLHQRLFRAWMLRLLVRVEDRRSFRSEPRQNPPHSRLHRPMPHPNDLIEV